jgi:hypothetical protein
MDNIQDNRIQNSTYVLAPVFRIDLPRQNPVDCRLELACGQQMVMGYFQISSCQKYIRSFFGLVHHHLFIKN